MKSKKNLDNHGFDSDTLIQIKGASHEKNWQAKLQFKKHILLMNYNPQYTKNSVN